MIKSKEAIQLLAFVLLIGHSRQGVILMGASFYEANASTKDPLQTAQSTQDLSPSGDQQQQQQQFENLAQGNRDNLRRYLLKDLDLDGHTLKQPIEQWRLIKLNQLLEALGHDSPTPLPSPPRSLIYRSGRTYPSASLTGADPLARQANLGIIPNIQQIKQQTSKAEIEPLQLQQVDKDISSRLKGRKPPSMLGLVWSPSRTPVNPGFINVHTSQVGTSKAGPHHHTLGTEEVAIHTPMHSRSISDYEWKRVENSRWNNLRGLWGKRADGEQYPNNFGGRSEAPRDFDTLTVDEQQIMNANSM